MLAGEDQSLRKQAVEKSLAIRADLAKTIKEDEQEKEEDEVEEEDEWEDEDDIDAEEPILNAAEKAAIQNLTVREFKIPTSYAGSQYRCRQVGRGGELLDIVRFSSICEQM